MNCPRSGFRLDRKRARAGREGRGRRPKIPLFSGTLYEWAPSADLLGDDVTAPAGGFGPGIIVASVAKFVLVAVTIQAGPRKADLMDPAVRCRVGPLPFPDDVVPPGGKEFHVAGSHIGRRLDAAFFLEPLYGGRIKLQVGGGGGPFPPPP